MGLQLAHDSLRLVGLEVDNLAHEALRSLTTNGSVAVSQFIIRDSPYYIPLLTSAELQTLDEDRILNLKVDTRQLFSLGIGVDNERGRFFVVIIWVAGQQLRKQLGFSPRHFHINLSATHEDHYINHQGIQSLLPGQFPSAMSPILLDHLTFTLLVLGHFQQALPFCLQSIQTDPKSHKGFLRYADTALRVKQYKSSMLAYACAFQRTDEPKLHAYCVKKMVECSTWSEWGCIFIKAEISDIPNEIQTLLMMPWYMGLRTHLSDITMTPKLCLESRNRLYLPVQSQALSTEPTFRGLPRFFRWLVPFYFAIMSTPRDESDIAALVSPHISIRHILTLTEETPLPADWFLGKKIKHTHLPIPNCHPPTIEQIDLIMRIFEDEDNLPLLVHCGGGKGRAATVAACYLVAYGFSKRRDALTQPSMSANDAILALRAIRPGSIETPLQEAFVFKWCSTIWRRQCVVPPLLPEPRPCPLEVEGELQPKNDLFILVGLPGSGKSWFSKALIARDMKGWAYISQDESGSRSSSESEIGRVSGRILLDRCNTASDDRKKWLKLASQAISPVCIWFDYDSDLCVSRAQNRADHPTLPPGNRVRRAVEQMRKAFVQPSLEEGFKAIVIVRSFSASRELVLLLSPPVVLFKYPRTSHLLNLGAATDDDIVSDSSVPLANGHVVITEKVDGANMGISLSADHKILVQNRSHYINSSTHEQFKKLGLWVDSHREELYEVLGRDEYFPERFILFGEWLSVTHSIPYTHLPDRFLAFDLYDRRYDIFVDRKSLLGILSSTTIHLVPVLLEGRLPCDEELRSLVQKQSQYWEGRIEGIHIKVERNGRVIARGKVVRGDFITGNKHWTKGKLSINSFV